MSAHPSAVGRPGALSTSTTTLLLAIVASSPGRNLSELQQQPSATGIAPSWANMLHLLRRGLIAVRFQFVGPAGVALISIAPKGRPLVRQAEHAARMLLEDLGEREVWSPKRLRQQSRVVLDGELLAVRLAQLDRCGGLVEVRLPRTRKWVRPSGAEPDRIRLTNAGRAELGRSTFRRRRGPGEGPADSRKAAWPAKRRLRTIDLLGLLLYDWLPIERAAMQHDRRGLVYLQDLVEALTAHPYKAIVQFVSTRTAISYTKIDALARRARGPFSDEDEPVRAALAELDSEGLPLELVGKLWNEAPEVANRCGLPPVKTAAGGLTDRESRILQALQEARASARDARLCAETIAIKSDGPGAKLNSFKGPLSALVRRGLLESQTGSGGGYWLTSRGQKLSATENGARTVRT